MSDGRPSLLIKRARSSTENGANEPIITPEQGSIVGPLEDNETLEPYRFEGDNLPHRSHVFLKKRDGNLIGIRKVARRTNAGNILNDTVSELKLYRKIISHPGWDSYVLPFAGGATLKDYVYIDFDYVKGNTLYDYMSTKPSRKHIYGILADVARALAFLTRIRIIHGDIKPDNIWIKPHGSRAPSAVLFDFGNGTDSPSDATRWEDLIDYMDTCVHILAGKTGLPSIDPDTVDYSTIYNTFAEFWETQISVAKGGSRRRRRHTRHAHTRRRR